MNPLMVPIALFVSVAFTVVGVAFARALRRRDEMRTLGPDAHEVVARLERMEQAIDAIAVEVERISEGQRFTTKLLSERSGGSALPPGGR